MSDRGVLPTGVPGGPESPVIMAAVLAARLSPAEARRIRRRVRLLEQLACGMSDPEIARAEGIQPDSAKSRVARLLKEMGVVNRAQAVAVGYETGMLATRVGLCGTYDGARRRLAARGKRET